MIRYYPKINAPFVRDERGRFVADAWADPVFDLHLDDQWHWYYKWNGTNVGMNDRGWFGRSERSTFTTEQADCLDNWYAGARDRVTDGQFLYGELVGPGINGNPHEWDELGVVEFEHWHGTPIPYGLCSVGTLNQVLAAHRDRTEWFGKHVFYVEGYVGRLATDPSVVTKIKVKDKWNDV